MGAKRRPAADQGPGKKKRAACSSSVVDVRTAGANAPLVPASPETLLASLTHPISPRDFLREYYRKRALVVHGDAGRFQDIIHEHLFGLDLRSLLENTASEALHVWTKPLSSTGEAGPIESFRTDDVDAALACHRAGASLYFQTPVDAAHALCAPLQRDLGMHFAAEDASGSPKGEIETFVSRKGHVTDWHFDFMENFTLQLRGTKTWKLNKNPKAHVLRGSTPHFRGHTEAIEQQVKVHKMYDPEFTDETWKRAADGAEEVTLTPGSFMYFPSGMWHRVECSDDSISINISLTAETWADVITSALRQYLWSDDRFREHVSVSSVRDAREQLAPLLSEVLSPQLRQHLTPEAVICPAMIRKTPDGQDASGSDGNSETEILRRNPLSTLQRAPEDEGAEAQQESAQTEPALPTATPRPASASSCDSSHSESDDEIDSDDMEELEGPDIPDGHSPYIINTLYGRDDMSSTVRHAIVVPNELDALMDRLTQARAGQEFRRSKLLDSMPEDLCDIAQNLLRSLIEHGFLIP